MFTVLLLASHLIAVNLACGLPVLGLLPVWQGRRRGSDDSTEATVGDACTAIAVARRLIWSSLLALLIGIALGGVMFALGDEAMKAAWRRLPERALWFALSELVFSAACIVGQGLLLRTGDSRGFTRGKSWAALALGLLASTNLLYHFPPLMSALGKLTADPTWSRAKELPRSELLKLMTSGEILALSAHFAFASLAVSAIFAMWIVAAQSSEGQFGKSIRRLAQVALGVTFVQIGVGVWVLAALESGSRDLILGGDWIAASFLGLAVLATLKLCERLATLSFGKFDGGAPTRAGWLLLAIVLLMTAALQRMRTGEHANGNAKRPQQQGVAVSMTLDRI
ncbi:hypothetical protein [Adhaeretor mobilis]|uniref:Uncharacterized protein n=1 Tax=Adhaeretor mobilis TaxID=1930276 RepID=A0A517MU74_9BACT|nr:hypothetical protein [Adhaeretor mobilis]QDS98429.1 hypothetical protein HG15A2_17060 [Adhaeretor mobilis]